MKKFLKSIRNYLGYSSTEYKALFLLIPICLIIGLHPLYKDVLTSYFYGDNMIETQKLDSLNRIFQCALQNDSLISSPLLIFGDSDKSYTGKKLNPNHITKEGLKNLGLKEKQIHNWMAYLKAGGRFNKIEDIHKIYGLSEEDYHRLLPHLQINKQFNPSPTSTKPEIKENNDQNPYETRNQITTKPKIRKQLDINQTDSIQLREIRGIGKILSSRIIRYRKALGGFVSLDQLNEVYGLDSIVVNRIKDHFIIESNFEPDKLNLKTGDSNQLKGHPYINYKQARLINNYIKAHPEIKSLFDLCELPNIDSFTIKKIQPYLKIQ